MHGRPQSFFLTAEQAEGMGVTAGGASGRVPHSFLRGGHHTNTQMGCGGFGGDRAGEALEEVVRSTPRSATVEGLWVVRVQQV